MAEGLRCDRHPGAPAGWWCNRCEQELCARCVAPDDDPAIEGRCLECRRPVEVRIVRATPPGVLATTPAILIGMLNPATLGRSAGMVLILGALAVGTAFAMLPAAMVHPFAALGVLLVGTLAIYGPLSAWFFATLRAGIVGATTPPALPVGTGGMLAASMRFLLPGLVLAAPSLLVVGGSILATPGDPTAWAASASSPALTVWTLVALGVAPSMLVAASISVSPFEALLPGRALLAIRAAPGGYLLTLGLWLGLMLLGMVLAVAAGTVVGLTGRIGMLLVSGLPSFVGVWGVVLGALLLGRLVHSNADAMGLDIDTGSRPALPDARPRGVLPPDAEPAQTGPILAEPEFDTAEPSWSRAPQGEEPAEADAPARPSQWLRPLNDAGNDSLMEGFADAAESLAGEEQEDESIGPATALRLATAFGLDEDAAERVLGTRPEDAPPAPPLDPFEDAGPSRPVDADDALPGEPLSPAPPVASSVDSPPSSPAASATLDPPLGADPPAPTRKALAEPSLAAFAEPEPSPTSAAPAPADDVPPTAAPTGAPRRPAALGAALSSAGLPPARRRTAPSASAAAEPPSPPATAPAAVPDDPLAAGPSPGLPPPPIPALETGEAPAWATDSLFGSSTGAPAPLAEELPAHAPPAAIAEAAAPPLPAPPVAAPPPLASSAPPPAAAAPAAPRSPDATDDDGEAIEYGTGGYFRLPPGEAPAELGPTDEAPPWETEGS